MQLQRINEYNVHSHASHRCARMCINNCSGVEVGPTRDEFSSIALLLISYHGSKQCASGGDLTSILCSQCRVKTDQAGYC